MPELSCPRERAALENRRRRAVSFLECSECHGLLFELTQLELALERFPTPGGLRHWIESVLAGATVDAERRCVCEGSPVMTAVERAGVEINVCPQCGNLWLDRGELEKIREREKEKEKKEQPTNALDLPDLDWDEAYELLDGLVEWFQGLIDDFDFDPD